MSISNRAPIPVVSMDDSDFWRDLAANTLNYWDEEGNFVIAPNTPENRTEKAAWVKRTWSDGNIPKWEG